MCESMMKSLGFVNFVLFHEVKEAVASLEKQMSKVLGIQLPKLTLLCESDTRSLTTPPHLAYHQLYYWRPHVTCDRKQEMLLSKTSRQ